MIRLRGNIGMIPDNVSLNPHGDLEYAAPKGIIEYFWLGDGGSKDIPKGWKLVGWACLELSYSDPDLVDNPYQPEAARLVMIERV